ncbi:MAG: hypothetical protein MUC96_01455 [Myxococcaceae bacterium]|jgi:hypothetical protein|nr:hypothetical protein [Myxococcaceae bacterium]
MAFKAQQLKKGLFDIHGLEDFVERKVHEVMQALGLGAKSKPAVARPAPAKVKAPAPKKAKVAAVKAPAVDALAVVLSALDASPKKAALVKAGKQKDQLLRSLIPLYLTRDAQVEVSSGVTSRFWAKFGVTFAAPNAAKALREHAGYSKRTKSGNQITPNGVKYVEGALAGKKG